MLNLIVLNRCGYNKKDVLSTQIAIIIVIITITIP